MSIVFPLLLIPERGLLLQRAPLEASLRRVSLCRDACQRIRRTYLTLAAANPAFPFVCCFTESMSPQT